MSLGQASLMANTADPAADAARAAHDTKMAEAASGVQINDVKDGVIQNPTAAQATQSTDPIRPEHIPEKFWKDGKVDTDAMAKAYTTLEKSRGKPADPNAADPAADPAGAQQANAVATAAQEFADRGEISEATIAALEAQGIDRGTVETYMAGIESTRLLAFTAAGGEDQYTAMVAWAAKALSDAEVAKYDAAVNSGKPKQMLDAVNAMKARFSAESSKEPNLLGGNVASTSAVQGYRSSAEMQADMRDKKYATDPAFRADVMAKIAASERAGVKLF